MGMTHGEPETYPRAADIWASATRAMCSRAEAVVTVQRDWGDRSNRKHARLKYTIEDRGLDAFRAEVEKRAGIKLGAATRSLHLDRRPLRLDRKRQRQTASDALHPERPHPGRRGRAGMLTGLRKIAEMHAGRHAADPNQNVIIANVAAEIAPTIEGSSRSTGWSSRSRGCGAIRSRAWRCRPAGSRSPKASATCPT